MSDLFKLSDADLIDDWCEAGLVSSMLVADSPDKPGWTARFEMLNTELERRGLTPWLDEEAR